MMSHKILVGWGEKLNLPCKITYGIHHKNVVKLLKNSKVHAND